MYQSKYKGKQIDEAISQATDKLPIRINDAESNISDIKQNKADKDSVPTKLSQLTDDVGLANIKQSLNLIDGAVEAASRALLYVSIHETNTNNPHGVTAEQIGALTSDSLSDELGKYLPQLENDIGALQTDMEAVQAQIGDIETAIDGITALQESYIGGEGA